MRRTYRWLLLVCLFVPCQGLRAQVDADAGKALQDSLVKKRFFLQAGSAEEKVRYMWDGTALVLTPPKLHTVAVVDVQAVKFARGEIKIEVTRHTLVRAEPDKLSLTGDEPATIVINYGTAKLDTILPW